MSDAVTLAMSVRGDELDVRRFIDAFQADGFHSVAPLPAKHLCFARNEDEHQSIRAEAWGTKRIAHKKWPTVVQFGPSRHDARATYRFSCDWDVPRPLFAKMSAAWPSIRFVISWAFADHRGGRSVWSNGQEEQLAIESPSLDDANTIDDGGVQWRAARDFFLATHDAWVSENVGTAADDGAPQMCRRGRAHAGVHRRSCSDSKRTKARCVARWCRARPR